MTEQNPIAEDEFLDDVEIYDGEPDFDVSQKLVDDSQDDEAGIEVPQQVLGLMAKIAPSVNTWQEALEWYRTHQTARQIGFDPDGMCLKVCRTARNIPARYLTAKQAQDATPREFRVHEIADLRRGMIAFSDDPNDSNRSGHIYTIIGRKRGFDLNDKAGVLTETNSVKANELVIVTLDYYERYWGDKFQFGATWLNGVEFDVPSRQSKVERFNNGGPVYNLKLLAKAGETRPKPKLVLQRIEDQIRRLPDNDNINHVSRFKKQWKKDRKIDLSLLDKAVDNGRVGVVKKVRDEIRRLIDTLPEE